MPPRSRLLMLFLPPLLIASVYAAARLIAFTRLFFTHSGIALTQAEARDTFLHYAVTGGVDPRREWVPRHIHQVWHDWGDDGGGGGAGNVSAVVRDVSAGGNETAMAGWEDSELPPDWDDMRGSCRALMPDWGYTLWTGQKSRDFIATEYPHFLSTYDGYAYPVQRVDAIRYFIMRHHGGIYLDLDNGCLENLTPLLYYPTWTTDGGRGALSNNILAATPQHPFWILVTESLPAYDRRYLFPYVTISYASGQWFETAMWEAYHAALWKPRRRGSARVSGSRAAAVAVAKADDNDQNKHKNDGEDSKSENDKNDDAAPQEQDLRLHRLLMDDRPDADPWIYFSHSPSQQQRGSSWANWDNALFLWIGEHLILLALAAAASLAALWCAVRACLLRRRRTGPTAASATRDGYRRLRHDV